jgi:hypothetical protein
VSHAARRLACLAGVVALAGGLAGSASAHADALTSFTVAAQAPVMQVTYDNPVASFHPLGEGEVNYALSTLDATRGHALSSTVWPGSAAGNLGSLVGVLGGPVVPELNDPVKADVMTGTGPDLQTTGGPGGAEMYASVRPAGPNVQTVAAKTTMGGLPLGADGHIGASSASSSVTLDLTTNTMTAKAVSTVADVSLGGVVSIGSVTSSATTISTNGATPRVTSTTVFQDVKIAGQEAYVDGSGVHIGVLGKPTNPALVSLVDQALAPTGMQIFFTAPYRVTIAGLTYDYASSVLLYWAPPEPNKDVVTVSLGGAAISMQVTPGSGAALPSAPAAGALPSSPGPTTLSLPAPGPSATGFGATPVATPAPAGGTPVAGPAPQAVALGAPLESSSRGVGASWIVLLAVLAALGGALLPRVPALLGGSTACRRERSYPTSRE